MNIHHSPSNQTTTMSSYKRPIGDVCEHEVAPSKKICPPTLPHTVVLMATERDKKITGNSPHVTTLYGRGKTLVLAVHDDPSIKPVAFRVPDTVTSIRWWSDMTYNFYVDMINKETGVRSSLQVGGDVKEGVLEANMFSYFKHDDPCNFEIEYACTTSSMSAVALSAMEAADDIVSNFTE